MAPLKKAKKRAAWVLHVPPQLRRPTQAQAKRNEDIWESMIQRTPHALKADATHDDEIPF